MPDISSFQLLGLGPATGNWFMRLAMYARQQAEIATARHDAGPRARGNAGALRDVAEKLEQMRFNPESPEAILGMWVFHLTGRTDPSEPYVPSDSARLVLARVGQEQITPWSDVLTAIFAAELKDLTKVNNRRNAELSSARTDANEARAARDTSERRLSTERGARFEAEAGAARLQAELDQLRAENEYLSAALENGTTVAAVAAANAAAPPVADASDFPSPAQMEQVFDKQRVRVAEGVYLQRKGGDTLYIARIGKDDFAWIASATDGNMTISMASAARARLLEAQKKERV